MRILRDACCDARKRTPFAGVKVSFGNTVKCKRTDLDFTKFPRKDMILGSRKSGKLLYLPVVGSVLSYEILRSLLESNKAAYIRLTLHYNSLSSWLFIYEVDEIKYVLFLHSLYNSVGILRSAQA